MNTDFVAALARRFPPRRKYLIGVSGGRDSVALLHALHTAGFRGLVVCHLNHGLRGRASGEDARFVRRMAVRWGLPFEGAKADVAQLAKTRRISLETAAREARYGFFAEVAERLRCRRLFLAHHADDQVETVLHHLLRGTGLAGLSGMSPESDRPLAPGHPPVRVFRPLLAIRREEIDTYLAAHDLPWREDESNAAGADSTRNRWRHELIPALSTALKRDPRPAVLRLSEIVRAEDQALEWWLNREWDTVAVPGGGGLRTAVLLTWPMALQRRALFRWLKQAGVTNLDFDTIERVRGILSPGGRVAKVNLPGDRHARRRAGCLFLESRIS